MSILDSTPAVGIVVDSHSARRHVIAPIADHTLCLVALSATRDAITKQNEMPSIIDDGCSDDGGHDINHNR